MAKNPVLGLGYRFATAPLLLLSRTLCLLNFHGFRDDLNACSLVVSHNASHQLCANIMKCVVVAEDHRFELHKGLDFIALTRAACFLLVGNIQGASTIEQQFVRVVTSRYRRTLRRKIREQLLAIQVSSTHAKSQILQAYICIAYYGHDYSGIQGLSHLLNGETANVGVESAIAVAARLKYPEPGVRNSSWHRKHTNRVRYIRNKLSLLECRN